MDNLPGTELFELKRSFRNRMQDNEGNKFILFFHIYFFLDIQVRLDRNNNDLTVYIQIINEIFSKSNPYHICTKCFSIESRDSVKYHNSSFLIKKKDFYPNEKDQKRGITLIS